MSVPQLDINSRINVALAVGNYLQAIDQFDVASQALARSCSVLRKQLRGPARFVVQVEYRHYLITSDREGNFEVELVESL